MTQEVFGLCYEFTYRHGHFMELFKEDGLDSKALSSLQIRMLEANQVPHLLPLDIYEVDSRIRLLYPLSSKRMLSHVLKVEALASNQFAKLMYTVVSTLDESKNYMLNEANYVLKDHLIFIGLDWSDVYLTYVPLAMPHGEEDVFPSLDKLLKKLSMLVVEADQQVIQNWISKHDSLQSLHAYKEALLSLMDESLGGRQFNENNKKDSNVAAASSHSETDDAKVISNALPKPGLPKAHLKRDINLHPIPNIPNSSPNVHLQNQKGSMVPITFKTLNQRMRWILIALEVICIVFLWQYYLANPSKSTLQIISGMTLLICDIGFILLYKGFPILPNRTDVSQENLSMAAAVQEGVSQQMTIASNISSTSSSTNSPSSPISATTAKPSDMENYYRNLTMHTTMLSPSHANATVFLGKSKLPATGPRFEFQVEGVSKIVHITTDLFTIGRGDGSVKVDLELEAVGVSRVHAEINRTSSHYEIRDAGSTNGTFLNDEPLVSYQAYPFKDGDIVRVIRQELTFRM